MASREDRLHPHRPPQVRDLSAVLPVVERHAQTAGPDRNLDLPPLDHRVQALLGEFADAPGVALAGAIEDLDAALVARIDRTILRGERLERDRLGVVTVQG